MASLKEQAIHRRHCWKRNLRHMEDYGYAWRKISWRQHPWALETCWLVGLFKRSGLPRKSESLKTELLPAISPGRVCRDKRAVVDRLFRFVCCINIRETLEWTFFTFKTPTIFLMIKILEDLKYPLNVSEWHLQDLTKQPGELLKTEGRTPFIFIQKVTRSGISSRYPAQNVDMGLYCVILKLSARELD